MGKGEIARDEQFPLYPQCFLFNQILVSPVCSYFRHRILFAAEMEEPKIGISGKRLKKNGSPCSFYASVTRFKQESKY